MVKQPARNEPATLQATPNLTPAQQVLQDLWEEHMQSEFVAHNPEDALATMVEDAYVNDTFNPPFAKRVRST